MSNNELYKRDFQFQQRSIQYPEKWDITSTQLIQISTRNVSDTCLCFDTRGIKKLKLVHYIIISFITEAQFWCVPHVVITITIDGTVPKASPETPDLGQRLATGSEVRWEEGRGDTHGQAEADKRREGGRALSRGHEDIRTQPLWSLRLRLNKLGSNLGKWPSLYCKHCTILIAMGLKWSVSVDHWKLLFGQTWVFIASFIKQLLPFRSIWIRKLLNWRILCRLRFLVFLYGMYWYMVNMSFNLTL